MSSEHTLVADITGKQPVIDGHLNATEAREIEPSLLPSSRSLLCRFAVWGLDAGYLDHLDRRIQRDPRDLHSHTRRVFHYLALDDADALYGSLIDLFLVLGPRGFDLRDNLLARAREQLSAEQCRFLEEHLESGLSASEALPDAVSSRLSKCVTGTTSIVTRVGDEAAGDPLDLARRALVAGDASSAQALLEGALVDDPGRAEISQELLALYRNRNLKRDFLRTYTANLGRRVALTEQWQALAAEFRSEPDGDGA